MAAGRARLAGRDLWRSGPAAPAATPGSTSRSFRSGALAHGFALLLVVLALGIVFALYLLVGAVRWLEGRPAINDHARTHLGWLLTGLALALVWGYLLEPYELLAGLGGPLDLARLAGDRRWSRRSWWAWPSRPRASPPSGRSRPRHALAAAGWIVLPLASLVGHWMVPPAMDGDGEPAASRRVIDQLDGLAYGLDGLAEERLHAADGPPAPPRVPALWNIEMIGHMRGGRLAEGGRDRPGGADGPGQAAEPAWLAVRVAPNGRASVAAVADDRVGQRGPGPVLLGQRHHAGAGPRRPPRSRRGRVPSRCTAAIGSRPGTGAASRWAGWRAGSCSPGRSRRGGCSSDLPPGSKVDWRLSPSERLAALAPFARLGRAGPQDREPRAGLGRRRLRRASRVSAQHPAAVARARNRRAPRRLPRHGRGRHGRDPDLSQARCRCVGRRLGRDRAGRRGARLGDPGGGAPGGAVPGRAVPGAGPASRASGSPSSAASEGRPAPAARSSRPRTVSGATDTTGPVRMAIYERAGERRARRRPHRHRRQRHGRASTGPLRLRHGAAEPQRAGEPLEPLPVLRRPERFDRAKTAAAWSADRCGSSSAPGGPVAYQSHFARDPRRRHRARLGECRGAGDRLRRGTHLARGVEQPAGRDRARARRAGPGDPAGRGAALAPARRFRAARRRLGRVRAARGPASATCSACRADSAANDELARPWGGD